VARRLFKRETLIRNLEKIVDRIPKLDLPADIVAVYAFGGMLREKRHLHDFDLVFLYSMSEKQAKRWLRFFKNFLTYDSESGRYPLNEIWSMLEPYWKQRIPLRMAFKDEELARTLSERGIVPQWAGCFSWTEILEGYVAGLFFPDIREVIRRMLLGKRVRGLQILVEEYEKFMKGDTILTPKNYVLAWSPEKPNVRENLKMSPEEKIAFITKELEFFIDKISTFKEEWMEAKRRVMELSIKASIRLGLEALEKRHSEVKILGSEPYETLKEKAETAREEMRKYIKETAILWGVAGALEKWIKIKDALHDHPAEDYISLWVIKDVRKRDAKEEEIREVLRTLKLPESHVITIREYGRTWYELPRNEDDRKRLLKKAEIEGKRRELILGIMKAVRPLDKDTEVYLEMDDEGTPRMLKITVYRPLEKGRSEEIMNALKKEGFKVGKWGDYISGFKEITLRGDEDLKELQQIARKSIRTCV